MDYNFQNHYNISNKDEFILSNTKTNTSEKDYNIFINSLDRDWYNNTTQTPLNFVVKFGGYQDNYLIVQTVPKNITSIGVNNVILSGRDYPINYSNTHVNIANVPYLLLNVNNIDNLNYGTNKNIDKSLAILHPDETVSKYSSSVLDSIKLSPLNKEPKIYKPNPLGSLHQLDISLTNHLGDTPFLIKDILDIKGIFTQQSNTSNTNSEYLVVETSTYFQKEHFKSGDLIKFQNYEFRDNSYAESITFDTFINRDHGHVVTHITKTDDTKLMYNRLYISIPSYPSTTTGNIGVESWFSSLKGKTSMEVMGNDTSGKLINTNLQTSILFKLKTSDKEFNYMR
jgi:hypothetical protein